MNNFKARDKVYCPKLSRKVLVPQETVEGFGSYPLTISIGDQHYCFTLEGKYSTLDEVPSLHHATEENHTLLEKLYGVGFEKPPVKPTSREIVRAMLARGDKCVPCWVSDDYGSPLPFNVCVLITQLVNDAFRTSAGVLWQYATPFDPRTGEPITELPT